MDANKSSGNSPTPDFHVSHNGRIWLLQPLSPAAHAWVQRCIPPPCGVAVSDEHIQAMIQRISNDGLVVDGPEQRLELTPLDIQFLLELKVLWEETK